MLLRSPRVYPEFVWILPLAIPIQPVIILTVSAQRPMRQAQAPVQ
jgi:hypothetical protein